MAITMLTWNIDASSRDGITFGELRAAIDDIHREAGSAGLGDADAAMLLSSSKQPVKHLLIALARTEP